MKTETIIEVLVDPDNLNTVQIVRAKGNCKKDQKTYSVVTGTH